MKRIDSARSLVSEQSLRELFSRLVRPPKATPAWLVLPAVLACECPVTTSIQTETRALTNAELTAHGGLATEDDVLPASSCDALCYPSASGSVTGNGNRRVLDCRLTEVAVDSDVIGADSAGGRPPDGTTDDVSSPPAPEDDSGTSLACRFEVKTDCGGVGRWVPGARVGGARPPLRTRARVDAATSSWVSHAAGLERLSVHAFTHLGRQLDRFRAPLGLRQRVQRARNDERRHARQMTALGRELGAAPRVVQVALPERLSLVDLAIENAVHGCLEETWGALLLHHQAATASRREHRRLFAQIAEDETRHAALSWELHAWALARLKGQDRAAVLSAMAAGLAALRARAAAPVEPELVTTLGLPDSVAAQRMFAALEEQLLASTSVV
ncbi:MAG: ferritin-like domain-containing protein [Myxococcales bacterium]|nr:ferritin-like domain-containing protein [Myxococcales bacterium]